jgi:hypothetical protein
MGGCDERIRPLVTVFKHHHYKHFKCKHLQSQDVCKKYFPAGSTVRFSGAVFSLRMHLAQNARSGAPKIFCSFSLTSVSPTENSRSLHCASHPLRGWEAPVGMTVLRICICNHQESGAEILRWELFASERLRVLRMTIASVRLWRRGTLMVWRGGGARLRGSVRISRSCGGVRGRPWPYLAMRRWAGCTRRRAELHRRR